MNWGRLSSLNAAAMEANRSTTSSCVSAIKAAQASMPMPQLSAIARINFNVLFREVAGPETRAALAAALERYADQALRGVQLFLQIRFREIGGQSATANRDLLELNVYLRWIDRHAGVSRR